MDIKGLSTIMKIIVCIKQVPATQKVAVDPTTGVLIRSGIDTKMNPYDLYALLLALRIKKQVKCELIALSMGPDSAKAVLKEAMALGCDQGVLISDRAFAGADVLATSYTLASVIKTIAPDVSLVICGNQTTDGDTAQVGAEMAVHLNMPFIGLITDMHDVTNDSIGLTSDQGNQLVDFKATLPLVVSVSEKIGTPDLPSYFKLRQIDEKKIRVVTLADLDDHDPSHYGLSGSPTQVEKIFEPTHDRDHVLIDGDASDAMAHFIDVMVANHYLRGTENE